LIGGRCVVRDVMRGRRHAARWLLSVGWLSRSRLVAVVATVAPIASRA